MHAMYFALVRVVVEYDILNIYFLFPLNLERWRLFLILKKSTLNLS